MENSEIIQNSEDEEMCDLLDSADIGDLREIADILGVMYQDDCKAEELTFYPVEPRPQINLPDIIDRIEANDPDLQGEA